MKLSWMKKTLRDEAGEGKGGSTAAEIASEAAAPASEPAAEASPKAPVADEIDPDPYSADSTDWADLATDDEDLSEDSFPPVEAKQPEPAQVEPAAAVEPAEPVIAKTEEASIPEVPATEAVAKPEEPQPTEEPPAQPQTQQRTSEELAALRDQVREGLVKNYALSEEDSDLFQTDPGKVLPKLAADLHLQIYQDVVRAVMANVPNTVDNLITTRDNTLKYVDKFYGDFPELKPYEKEVLKFSAVWRQMNPQASPETAITEVGKHMKIALGLNGPAAPQTGAPPAAAVQAPPPTPAPNSAAPTRSAVQPRNVFEAFAEELLAEED